MRLSESELDRGEPTAEGGPKLLPARLRKELTTRPEFGFPTQVLIGVLAALIAVAVRYSLPLRPQQLPTITVVICIAIVTTFVGLQSGIVAAIVGGLLCWYLFFNPYSWDLSNGAWIPLIGFFVIASVIVSTAWLYRSSERARHSSELLRLQAERNKLELFAQEMAHRLNNALTIVQSIAFQTIGSDTHDAKAFAGRLRAIAEANRLLTKHVSHPSALAMDVIRSALGPFGAAEHRIKIEGSNGMLNGSQAVSLALCIHELATNALKYGALSVPTGEVILELRKAPTRYVIHWKELGGPVVAPSAHSGFGSRLLKRTGAGTKLAFEPDGLRCTIELELGN
ncbi:DUF4118 domain-containing protein [Sphingomonas piscis]|uniref:histidine kinase n=1 Tax=Sphingomonas piscis TaxID=2714943 RepID=A0A6G7YMB6_9SPHN|nr:HWE histidine kinase domain-containing protein [Sphingomonas piscis]QIK77890.1 DUF4118 domain-containing protein [Sphingomonas piscis]